MSNTNELKFKHKKQPFWNFIKKIFSIFIRRPKIINLAGNIEDKAIYISNHYAKVGPLYLNMYYPKYHYMWGAHQMLGKYKDRFYYLRDIFYIQKKGYNKFKATLISLFEAVFNKMIYKGIKVIATYQDGRLKTTLKQSMEVLNNNIGIIIYPEDSNNGYFDVLTKFNSGFIALSLMYYRKYDIDLPIYPSYVNVKKRIIIIDKPLYVNELINEGKTIEEIAEIYKDKVNSLFFNYLEKDQYKNELDNG